MTWPPVAWQLRVTTQAERDASLVFRYNPKQKNPKTSMPTVHTWFSSNQTYCGCGRFDREDPRLKEISRAELPGFYGLLCRRCTWSDPAAERRLRGGPP